MSCFGDGDIGPASDRGSVPLRGVGCFGAKSEKRMREWMFPSPCGVWVVSEETARERQGLLFPSPCGVWVVSMISPCKDCTERLFPSPCGVWVVSVRWHSGAESLTVSVPLRGVGCFTKGEMILVAGRLFPSPCGVWVVSRYFEVLKQMFGFPSPCGV